MRFIDKLYSEIEVVEHEIKLFLAKKASFSVIEYEQLVGKRILLDELIADYECGRIE